jgi:hypothetical protein
MGHSRIYSSPTTGSSNCFRISRNLKQLVINVLEVIRFVHKYNRLPPEQETIIVFTYKCHDAHIQVNISARGLDLPIFFR